MIQNVHYIVRCLGCPAKFDAAKAAWCHCVAKRATLVCPQCERCVCQAGPAAVRKFWVEAPSLLHDRHRDEQKFRADEAARNDEAAEILIVDDDEEIRLAAAYMLQEMGYRVATSSNPDEVLSLIAERPPRLVLTDALMPKMDGRVLCSVIKSHNHNVRVVIMTSLYTSPRYKYEALKNFHADGYLAKPIASDDLREVISKLVPLRMRPREVNA
jgi:CheY-like chemotaxis protein